MNEVFVKAYVLISLWFWAGMLLSNPLRTAFREMHCRVLNAIYDATWGRVKKAFNNTTIYIEAQGYEIRVRIARTLVKEELLEEMNEKNFIAAIARARQMDQWSAGTTYDDLEKLSRLVAGKTVDRELKEAAVKTAFELCDTDLLNQIITRIPKAQERILLAFEQAEGTAPYDSVYNEEYRKFIRE